MEERVEEEWEGSQKRGWAEKEKRFDAESDEPQRTLRREEEEFTQRAQRNHGVVVEFAGRLTLRPFSHPRRMASG
jgi:hypothetical protein